MLFSLIKKELLMELRSKQIVLSMLFFGLAIILIFAFSSNVSKVVLSNYAPGMFWLMNLFIVVLGVHRSFAYEKDYDAFSILISSPVDRGIIFIAKWISGFLFITITQLVILIPFFKLLLLDIPIEIFLFISTALLINLAIMAVANLVSGIVIRSNFSEILLPLLLFPLLSPLTIAATKISKSIIDLESFAMWNVWVLIVASVVVIFGLAGYALFDHIIEE
ncbi:MAG: heme exporter protein CcmB [Candidatus Neomarinimicrobiota bacterium]|nr:heme exporter protein CcmB [Candidatus Neomarinimicrobiota bacterium]